MKAFTHFLTLKFYKMADKNEDVSKIRELVDEFQGIYNILRAKRYNPETALTLAMHFQKLRVSGSVALVLEEIDLSLESIGEGVNMIVHKFGNTGDKDSVLGLMNYTADYLETIGAKL